MSCACCDRVRRWVDFNAPLARVRGVNPERMTELIAILDGAPGATESAATAPPTPEPSKPKSCNLHKDCDVAEAEAKEQGKPERYGAGSVRLYHCSADDCEDCFGC